ncbi:MAG: hypothetical protein GXP40_09870 [Chloroflexi bacterium]|nr:hypothetical protein [Chloroflexota bacterium]
MSKKAKKRSTKKKQRQEDGLPMIVFVLLAGGGLLGFLGGETIFYTRPHPVHWATALAVALAGYLIGLVIYRLRGDILG